MLGIHILEIMKDHVKDNFDLNLAKIDEILLPWKGKTVFIWQRDSDKHLNCLSVDRSLPSFSSFEPRYFSVNVNQKRSKGNISYNTYDNGGLNLKNIESLNQYLKFYWIS